MSELEDVMFGRGKVVACQLIGGPFDGLSIELRGVPPAAHIDLPKDGLPRSEKDLYDYLEKNPNAKFVRYMLDWWSPGKGIGKYRHKDVAPPTKREASE